MIRQSLKYFEDSIIEYGSVKLILIMITFNDMFFASERIKI